MYLCFRLTFNYRQLGGHRCGRRPHLAICIHVYNVLLLMGSPLPVAGGPGFRFLRTILLRPHFAL
jgi:hypothetical protein